MDNHKTDEKMLGTTMQNTNNVNNSHARFTGNHLSKTGTLTCRFELFVRWPESAGRQMNPFKYRGDRMGELDPNKMLAWLVKHFIKNHHTWVLAELWDNTKPINDPARKVLSLKNGRIEENRLKDYPEVLEIIHVPEEWIV